MDGIWDLVVKSELDWKGIDAREMGKYLAVMCEKEELRKHRLISCIPIRTVEL